LSDASIFSSTRVTLQGKDEPYLHSYPVPGPFDAFCVYGELELGYRTDAGHVKAEDDFDLIAAAFATSSLA
jgi:hypothetical protein